MNYLPSGQEDFRQIRENTNLIYIDKTYFIKEWWESPDKVTLISRPPSFGKTLNMSMINYFFSNQYENSHYLFENLSIFQETQMMRYQGRFPLIFLDFSDLKSGDSDFIKKTN